VLESLAVDHRAALLEAITTLLRGGSGSGRLVVSSRGLGAGGSSIRSLASLFGSSLLLRLTSREDHVLSGGEARTFDPRLPAGGGWWRGSRVQVAVVEESAGLAAGWHTDALASPPTVAFDAGSLTMLVSRSPAGRIAELNRSPSEAVPLRVLEAASLADSVVAEADIATVVVGDPDSWQAKWSLYTRMRPAAAVIFDGCTTSEFRSLSGARTLPPPLASVPNRVWLLVPEQSAARAAL
jgi:S-DNA-T family DNA segregation ATPase FtsK/SpoIIIE